MTVLYQNASLRAIEQSVIASGTLPYQLMTRAGEAAFALLQNKWPNAKKITVFCGPGNNGGDGLVLARLAKVNGIATTVYLMADPNKFKEPAVQAFQAAVSAGMDCKPYHPDLSIEADVVVDALLGTGLNNSTLSAPYAEAIALINATDCPVMSLDIPSGLQADTGDIKTDAVKADVTLSFIGLKQGMYTAKGPAYCGIIQNNTLAIPPHFFADITTSVQLLSWDQIKPLLPKRNKDTYKGNYGHVLVIGGDYGMGGAVRMAAEAAARVGAGLVTVATRPEHVPIVSGSRPELMCHQAAEASSLDPLLERASVVVIGPGLGKTEWAESLLARVLESDLPKVLDADSLNILSRNPTALKNCILTPHPGEASRLLNTSCQEIQSNRFLAVRQLQELYDAVVVLKGLGTLIKSDADTIFVCPAGNPGMATGGMGDILSGVIGGLIAQNMTLEEAAECGVFIHAVAADTAAAEGGERGLLATDLLPYLRMFVNPDQKL